MSTAMVLRLRSLFFLLGASALLASQAQALPQYRVIPVSGDVNFIADLNNNNEVLMGSGQCGGGPCTYVRPYNTLTQTLGSGTRVVGLPFPGAPAGDSIGTVVEEFNSAGDMIGISDFGLFGELNIPTIWIAGAPYDRSDPANAGLSFTRDPGTGTTSISLATLEIVNPSALGLLPGDLAAVLAGTLFGRFNANGYDTATITGAGLTDGWLLAPVAAVPEPATMALVGLCPVLLAGQRRRA